MSPIFLQMVHIYVTRIEKL